MATELEPGLQQFEWQPQPLAAALVNGLVDDFCGRSGRLAEFRDRMRSQTGTRLTDWIDHLAIPADEPRSAELAQVGFHRDYSDDKITTWRHADGLFPAVRVGGELRRLAIKVESIDDFLAALGRVLGDTLPYDWPAPGTYRKVQAFVDSGVELCGIERHGNTGFRSEPASPDLLETAHDHLAAFRVRARPAVDAAAGFADAAKKIASAAADLGTGWACDLFFRCEREFWQSRNRAARVQFARLQRLGLGWANHDHHTYRSSREHFAELIVVLEQMGFVCRERFYAGREAGWGAQVLEQSDCGIVIFADVDLSPEELADDFAHQPLAERDELGTVGLWCRLHGEAFLAAGMHHLEAQFDFDAARQQLADAGVETMAPFTDFPFLRQAFTGGEIWQVDPVRIDALLAEGLITDDQAEKFRREGAIGSHLEILERNDGYKGFNQTGVSDIIRRTDPRFTG
jgi:hypothetical protein